MVDKSERDLERRGGAGHETARKHKRKLFRQKVGGFDWRLECSLQRSKIFFFSRPDF